MQDRRPRLEQALAGRYRLEREFGRVGMRVVVPRHRRQPRHAPNRLIGDSRDEITDSQTRAAAKTPPLAAKTP
jgi:hypothetical protein